MIRKIITTIITKIQRKDEYNKNMYNRNMYNIECRGIGFVNSIFRVMERRDRIRHERAW